MTKTQETDWEDVQRTVRGFAKPSDKNDKFIVAVVRDGSDSDVEVSGDERGKGTKAAIAALIILKNMKPEERKRLLHEASKL